MFLGVIQSDLCLQGVVAEYRLKSLSYGQTHMSDSCVYCASVFLSERRAVHPFIHKMEGEVSFDCTLESVEGCVCVCVCEWL